MKKTFVKKLALSKMTVVNLDKMELSEVKGGAASFNCWTGVYCTIGCPGGPSAAAVCPTLSGCYTMSCTAYVECEG